MTTPALDESRPVALPAWVRLRRDRVRDKWVLLAPERLNRVAEQHRTDRAQIGFDGLLDRLVQAVFQRDMSDPVQQRLATTTALALARVQRDPALAQPLALALDERLRRLGAELGKGRRTERDWARGLGRLLGDREALDKALAEQRRLPQIPPGMPIGGAGDGEFHN